MKHPLSVPVLRPLAAALVAVCLAGAVAPAAAADVAVGTVSLLIGVARVVHLDGSSEPLKRGAPILVGDRVETSANGHVHLRFIDNGAAAVRPDSVLEVQAYRYDADRPQVNEVRLRVEQGTARSISGAATELDKNRFRLNTPIAAIGVRGTDFIVRTDVVSDRVTVADGAVVVGALGGACAANALGPCQGTGSRLLSADMGRLMAEVRHGERVARVVPTSTAGTEIAGGTAEERMSALYAAELAARAAAQQAADAKGFAQMRDIDFAAAGLLSIPAVAAANTQPDMSAQLMWGHWTFASPAYDGVSRSRAVAETSGRQAVAGTYDGRAAWLFRARDTTGDGLLHNEADGVVDFKLTHATATYEANKSIEAAAVNGAKLTLDFGRRTFATALALSSVTGGATELRVAGTVRPDGTFAVVRDNSTQFVSGAVSFDGKEAGYLFERNVGGGLFRGKTLWGR